MIDLETKLLAALQSLLSFPAIREAQDQGLIGAGWQSYELRAAIEYAERIVQEAVQSGSQKT